MATKLSVGPDRGALQRHDHAHDHGGDESGTRIGCGACGSPRAPGMRFAGKGRKLGRTEWLALEAKLKARGGVALVDHMSGLEDATESRRKRLDLFKDF